MRQYPRTIRAKATMFVSRHPRLTVTLALLVLLIAVQGSVAADGLDCTNCVEATDSRDQYNGPDDP